MNKKIVTQLNKITQAQQSVTLLQKKILHMCFAEINTNLIQVDNEPIEVSFEELYKISGYKTQMSQFVMSLEKEMKSFSESSLRLDVGETTQWIPWTGRVQLDRAKGTVSVQLNPVISRMFSSIDGEFTRFFRNMTISLSSIYAIRLYELAMQYKPEFKPIPEMTYQELRDHLGLQPKKYSDFNNFKRRVLNRAIDEINEKTDMQITYDIVERDRRNNKIFIFKNDWTSLDHKNDLNPSDHKFRVSKIKEEIRLSAMSDEQKLHVRTEVQKRKQKKGIKRRQAVTYVT